MTKEGFRGMIMIAFFTSMHWIHMIAVMYYVFYCFNGNNIKIVSAYSAKLNLTLIADRVDELKKWIHLLHKEAS